MFFKYSKRNSKIENISVLGRKSNMAEPRPPLVMTSYALNIP